MRAYLVVIVGVIALGLWLAFFAPVGEQRLRATPDLDAVTPTAFAQISPFGTPAAEPETTPMSEHDEPASPQVAAATNHVTREARSDDTSQHTDRSPMRHAASAKDASGEQLGAADRRDSSLPPATQTDPAQPSTSTDGDDSATYCEDPANPESPDGYVFARTWMVYDLTPTHALHLNPRPPVGETIGTTVLALLTRSICSLRPWPDDLPKATITLVLIANDADLQISIGSGWIAEGAWLAPLPDEQYAWLNDQLNPRRDTDHSFDLPIAQFAAELELQRRHYPNAPYDPYGIPKNAVAREGSARQRPSSTASLVSSTPESRPAARLL